MPVFSVDFKVSTSASTELIDITPQVNEAVRTASFQRGLACVTTPHTTAALLITQFQAALMHDLVVLAEQLVPRQAAYRHNDPRCSDCEGSDAHAHLRAALFGRAVAVSITNGAMMLGAYQSIILAEFDGPRTREVTIQLAGD